MEQKLYILLTVNVDTNGSLGYSMGKYETLSEAQRAGENALIGWMEWQGFVEEGKEDSGYTGRLCRIKRYSDSWAEACDTDSVAEFDYMVEVF
ncbi:hypothetical protein E5358_12690 [Palleniella muris]|uniref:Uncharacterized protein n=1 Tax=Palleniella muris TaxID=3038145 RepID=A0AC61QMK8_9BACT|nr:hypothetical protein [Palleniella muris]TGX80507.1 hypothetical protein E5358_12690 [Palleniella muris]